MTLILKKSLFLLSITSCALFSLDATASKFSLSANTSLNTTYTDNLFLTPQNSKESETIYELNPSLHLRGDGKRMDLSVDYRMQNIAYENNEEFNDTKHQLSARADTELVEDIFFLEARANHEQRTTSSMDRTDQFNLTPASTTDVTTYGLTPQLRQRFGRYAEGNLTYQVNKTDYEDDTSVNITNTTNKQTVLTISSGPKFDHWTWNFNYSNRKEEYEDSSARQEPELERATLENFHKVSAKTSLVTILGYEKQRYERDTTIEGDTEGPEWQAGLLWSPNSRTSVQLTGGERYYGNTASLTLRHERSRTLFSLDYTEEVTTDSLINLDSAAFDDDGAPTSERDTSRAEPSVLLTKTLSASIRHSRKRTTLALRLAVTDRENQQTEADEKTHSVLANATIQLTRRSQVGFNIYYLEEEFEISDRIDDLLESSIEFERMLGEYSSIQARYTYGDQDSTSDDLTYKRNVIYLGLTARLD